MFNNENFVAVIIIDPLAIIYWPLIDDLEYNELV